MRPRASSTRSFGELNGRPSNSAARITLLPVFISVRVIRRPPNAAPSATTSRPWPSNTIPLDMPLGERKTAVVLVRGSQRQMTRLISGGLADRDVREIHRAVRRLRGTLGEEPVVEQTLELGARRYDGRILCGQHVGSEDDEHSHDTNPAPHHAAAAAGAGPASTNRLVTGSTRKLRPSRVRDPRRTRSPATPNTTSSAARFPTT